MKIIFFGTPEFAVKSLDALIVLSHAEVAAVVTQPDRPKGRGGKITFPPVKQAAVENGIPVLQPERVRNKAFIAELAEFRADLFIVAAYGQIFPKTVLNMPRLGCLNVHASLLPKYRGASPINQAIINGDKTTGITIMRMDTGLDTGDMLYKKEISIADDDTAGTLHDKLAVSGGAALSESLALLESGELKPEKQNNAEATYAPILTKDMGRLDFNMPAAEIVNRTRGLDPWPGAYAMYGNEIIKVWRAETGQTASGEPSGRVLGTPGGKAIEISVNNGKESVLLTEIQAPGGRRMAVREYLKGHDISLYFQ